MVVSTADFKNGLHIEWEGNPYTIIWFQHHKPGKGGAIMRVKLRNLQTGSIIERSFKSGEKFKDISVDKRKVQYLYSTGDMYYFMDMENYEQMEIKDEMIGLPAKFLKENMEVYIMSIEGSIIGIDLPLNVILGITYTEPGVKGDTVSRTLKSATVETGVEIKVPLFINVGDKVKIDTRTGEYIERM
ncbi:MAG: elongation factor P [bacterium]